MIVDQTVNTPAFTPITFAVTCESAQELAWLYAHMNCSTTAVMNNRGGITLSVVNDPTGPFVAVLRDACIETGLLTI